MHWWAETSVDPELLPAGSSVVRPAGRPQIERDLVALFTTASSLLHLGQPSEDGSTFWQAAVLVDESTRSQFDVLVECGRNGVPLPDTLACLATSGTGFHGNRGRSWTASRGNLHFSSFCRTTLDAADCGPALSMLPTVAVTDVLLSLGVDTSLAGARLPIPWIKWVNDVFLNRSKVSGSLVASQVEGDQIVSFVLGIGLNVGVAPVVGRAGEFGDPTSLNEQGFEVTLPTVFQGLMAALATRIGQLKSPVERSGIIAAYQERLGGKGELVELFPENSDVAAEPSPIARGRLRAVHPDLSLEIEGSAEAHRGGRLRFVGNSW